VLADNTVVDLASGLMADGDLRSLQAGLRPAELSDEDVRQVLAVIGELDLDNLVALVMASLR
jgi:hypothetical protein